MRKLSTSAALLLAACAQNPPASPEAISQYICPNGQIARVSLSQDLGSMRLSFVEGRSYTLGRQPAAAGLTYSNSHYTARLEKHQLHLTSVGKLLPEHCQLQIPAAADTPASAPGASAP